MLGVGGQRAGVTELSRLPSARCADVWRRWSPLVTVMHCLVARCTIPNSLHLYPWVHQWCNNLHTNHQMAPIAFPDVDPSQIPNDVSFSMTAGDFLEVYTMPSVWDCVAMVFFLDTAHNVISYVEAVWNILKPGGYWINLGQYVYVFSSHFPDICCRKSACSSHS